LGGVVASSPELECWSASDPLDNHNLHPVSLVYQLAAVAADFVDSQETAGVVDSVDSQNFSAVAVVECVEGVRPDPALLAHSNTYMVDGANGEDLESSLAPASPALAIPGCAALLALLDHPHNHNLAYLSSSLILQHA